MSNSQLFFSGIIGVFIGFIILFIFHRYKLSIVREGIKTAEEWEENAEQSEIESQVFENDVIFEAAEIADVNPEQVPDELKRQSEYIDELEEQLESIRERWARSWWEALQREFIDLDTPHAIHITLPNGTSEEARSFARFALDNDQEIAIITGEGDGSFAVGVSGDLSEQYPANSVAQRITEITDRGGSDGTTRLAAGGGANPENITAAGEKVCDKLSEKLNTD